MDKKIPKLILFFISSQFFLLLAVSYAGQSIILHKSIRCDTLDQALTNLNETIDNISKDRNKPGESYTDLNPSIKPYSLSSNRAFRLYLDCLSPARIRPKRVSLEMKQAPAGIQINLTNMVVLNNFLEKRMDDIHKYSLRSPRRINKITLLLAGQNE